MVITPSLLVTLHPRFPESPSVLRAGWCAAEVDLTVLAGSLTDGHRPADCAGVMELRQIGNLLDAGEHSARGPSDTPPASAGCCQPHVSGIMNEMWRTGCAGDHDVALCSVERTESIQADGAVLYTGLLREKGYI